jgi:transcriptional regulator with XRE-family HTH domain
MTARPIPGGRDPTRGHPPSDPSEAEQATADSLDTEPVRLLAIRFGEELRRRRREAGLHQHDLADRIAYHRSYLSQVERGRQVPAEQFAMLCDRALEAGGALMGMFRELADEREARRREVAAERWRKRFHASSDAPAEAIAVPEAALSKLAGASLSSSDTSMERRPFVRMVGTFASAAMLEALGVDLLNLLRAMQGSRVSRPMLEETELAILRFHQLYKELPPTELFPYVRDHLQAVTGLLGESQPIEIRRRLCSVAGHLAGLRAWLTFDLGDPTAAHIWYEAALQPALEAQDEALAGWLLGGQSLIPSYSGDHGAALELVRWGQSHGSRGANVAVQAWLAALEARAHAGLGDAAAFRQAQDLANNALDGTQPDERRHGMNFDATGSTSPTTRARVLSRSASPTLPSRCSMLHSRRRTQNTSRPARSCNWRWPPPIRSSGRSTRRARSPAKRWTFRPISASGPSPSGLTTCSASWSPGAGGLRSRISASAWWRRSHHAW